SSDLRARERATQGEPGALDNRPVNPDTGQAASQTPAELRPGPVARLRRRPVDLRAGLLDGCCHLAGRPPVVHPNIDGGRLVPRGLLNLLPDEAGIHLDLDLDLQALLNTVEVRL